MEEDELKKVNQSFRFMYNVREVKREVVRAPLPMQDQDDNVTMPLSNLDLTLPPICFSIYLVYRKSNNNHIYSTMVARLKESLAKELMVYYPFSGELVLNKAGEPELLCNNCGVEFIEAYADVELTKLPLWDPDKSMGDKLIPKINSGVLSVQVTELSCSSLVLACTFDHRIADGYSANMFLLNWANRPTSLLPSFNRSLLIPSTTFDLTGSYLDQLYVKVPSHPPPSTDDSIPIAVSRLYNISADHIKSMKAEAMARSSLEGFTAHIWRLMARSCIPLAAGKECRLGMVVDGRSRMDSPETIIYFGNVVAVPFTSLPAEELAKMSLSDVASALRAMLCWAATGEFFQGLVDWVEAHRPVQTFARAFCDDDGNPALVVSSGRRFPVKEIDFGWGSPVFGSYHVPRNGTASYVMPMPVANAGNGAEEDWVVFMRFVGETGQELLRVIEEDHGTQSIFRPFAI